MMRQRRRVHSHQIIIQVGGETTAGAEDGQQQMFVASLHNTAVPSIRRREGDRFLGIRRWRDPAVQKRFEKEAGVVMRLSTVPDTPGEEEQAEVKEAEAGAAARELSVSRLPPAYDDEQGDDAQHVVIEMMPMQHRAEGEAGVSPRAAAAAQVSEGQQRGEEAPQGKEEAVPASTTSGDSPVLVLSPAAEDEKDQQEYEAVVAELLREKEEQEAKLRRIAQQIDDMKRRREKREPTARTATADQTSGPPVLSISLSPPSAEADSSCTPLPSELTGETATDTGLLPAPSSSSSSASSIPVAALLHLPVPMAGLDTAGDGVSSSGRSEGSGSVLMLGNRRFSI